MQPWAACRIGGDHVLIGHIWDDKKRRFTNGRLIRTSILVEGTRLSSGKVVRTLNTRYLLVGSCLARDEIISLAERSDHPRLFNDDESSRKEDDVTRDTISSELSPLKSVQGDQIRRLERLLETTEGPGILERAVKIFGSEVEAAALLTSQQLALAGHIPAELALTGEGRMTLRTLMTQIEYGVYV